MGLILTATSLPSSVIPDTSFRFADKILHFSMYAGLGLLLARSMDTLPRTTAVRTWLAAFIFCVALGALDEWHQTYIQGRSTEFADWLADSAGGLAGSSLWMFLRRFHVFSQ